MGWFMRYASKMRETAYAEFVVALALGTHHIVHQPDRSRR